ncbi:MBL fold metallo-hydrolase [Halorubellus sp. PRR65]|uniref:MBL fold metallo-hydrolase n=1 Tax=Halorubellus sp. PRR65 TaxID=3098148 RepID=UPI002B25CE40|nr:MBL fold metallo-hydrolase [Halorubellus sp. PRR65]
MDSDTLPDVTVVDTELFGAPGLHAAYLVESPEPVLVDAGAAPAADVVERALADRGVGAHDLAAIVPTHVHLDHAGAVGALADRFPDATVYVHERGRPYLTDADRLSRLVESARRAVGDAVADQYGTPTVVPEARTEALGDGDAVPCGDRALDVVHAPGHAPHQIALHDRASGALFAGDAAGMSLGGDLLPTTPAPDFDLDASLDTVARLRDRDLTALCYGHFGVREDAADALDAYAELLPEWVDAVERELADPGVETRSDLVAALRDDWASPTLERDVQGVVHALDADG